MHAQIVLNAVRGPLAGKTFSFHDHTLCTIGRSRDCLLVLPEDGDGRMVSRRHCLLDINPPHVGICDLGSLNGTYVNGVCLAGHRQHPEQVLAAHAEQVDRELHTGDVLQVGHHVFLVEIVTEEESDNSIAEEAGSLACSAR